MIPGTIAGGYLSQRLLANGYSIGSTRKILESICMGTEMVCLVIIGEKYSLNCSSRKEKYDLLYLTTLKTTCKWDFLNSNKMFRKKTLKTSLE
jgi:hypothetical protein